MVTSLVLSSSVDVILEYIFDTLHFVNKPLIVDILDDKLIEPFKIDKFFVPVNDESIVQELFRLLIDILLPPIRVMLFCLLLLKFETDVFKEPISLERLSNEVLRFVILSL